MVERHLAKVNVASSNLVFRSKYKESDRIPFFLRKEFKMSLPNDPVILLSFVNTKLRDIYSSLDELCDDMEADKETIISKCGSAGYLYSAERNQFI